MRPICKQCTNAENRASYLRRRELKRAQNKRWKQRNAAGYRAQQRGYYRKNCESIRARHKQTRDANLDVYRARELASHHKNPQTWADASARRRARKKGAPVVERVYRRVVYQTSGGRCYLCGERIAFEEMHLEHLIPLSKGGEHSYANVRASCSFCNLSKGDRLADGPLLCFGSFLF